MKVLFFDILNNSSNKMYKIIKDVNLIDKTYIYINKNILKSFYKRSFLSFILNFKYKEEIFCVFSKEFEKSDLKKYIILSFKNKLKIINIVNIKSNNVFKYLENEDINSRLLLISDYNISKNEILRYIYKFKYIDILDLSCNINKNIINNINSEYGININIINSNDLTKYDIYVIFSSINLIKYTTNNDAKIVNLLDYEDDIFTIEYEEYIKNKDEFIEANRYSLRKLGKIIMLKGEN